MEEQIILETTNTSSDDCMSKLAKLTNSQYDVLFCDGTYMIMCNQPFKLYSYLAYDFPDSERNDSFEFFRFLMMLNQMNVFQELLLVGDYSMYFEAEVDIAKYNKEEIISCLLVRLKIVKMIYMNIEHFFYENYSNLMHDSIMEGHFSTDTVLFAEFDEMIDKMKELLKEYDQRLTGIRIFA